MRIYLLKKTSVPNIVSHLTNPRVVLIKSSLIPVNLNTMVIGWVLGFFCKKECKQHYKTGGEEMQIELFGN
jgi:hypothetical protein